MIKLALTLILLSVASASAKTKMMVVTAYCPCEICCAFYSGSATASGARPRVGTTAAGPRWMSYGTVLKIPGVGQRIVQDRLARAYDGRIDIFMRSHREAVRFGARRLKITY